MAHDFDRFPLDDILVKPMSGEMSEIWKTFMATFYDNLVLYLSAGGFFLPLLTTQQRDALIQTVNGQIIYNTTVDAPQFYQASSKTWRTYSFT
jgi:hypothetical protein